MVAEGTAKRTNVVDPFADDGFTVETVREYGEPLRFSDTGDAKILLLDAVKEVELDDDNNPGKTRLSKVYSVVDKNGELWSLWGSFNVDAGMESIGVGEYFRIEYRGKKTLSGGHSVQTYRIAKRA